MTVMSFRCDLPELVWTGGSVDLDEINRVVDFLLVPELVRDRHDTVHCVQRHGQELAPDFDSCWWLNGNNSFKMGGLSETRVTMAGSGQQKPL
jgi:hypothetical protein